MAVTNVLRQSNHVVSWLVGPGVRVLVFAVLTVPFLGLLWGVINASLGPDPAEHLMHVTGEWALRILVLVLLARPLAQKGWPSLFRYRRMLGLFVFFYGTVHLLVFAQVYIGWRQDLLLEELAERPYVLVGSAAWLGLLPLAITSTDRWRRYLRQGWRRLHRLVYPVAALAWCHVWWLARSDIGDAVVYGLLLGSLLGWRLQRFMTKVLRSRKPSC